MKTRLFVAVLAAVAAAGCGTLAWNDVKCLERCGCYSDAELRNPSVQMQKHFAATPACQGTKFHQL